MHQLRSWVESLTIELVNAKTGVVLLTKKHIGTQRILVVGGGRKGGFNDDGADQSHGQRQLLTTM